MSKLTDRAEALIAPIEGGLPFRVNQASGSGEDPMLATIRDKDGWPIISPHPEAISMLQGRQEVFRFIEEGPAIIRALLDELKSSQSVENS